MKKNRFPQPVANENNLVCQYTPLVHKICHHYESVYTDGYTYDDAFQDGLIGLLYAIRWYDAKTGVPFMKTAQLTIRTYIMKGIRNAVEMVHRKHKEQVNNPEGRVGVSSLDAILNDAVEDDNKPLPKFCTTPEEDVINDELHYTMKEVLTKMQIDAVMMKPEDFRKVYKNRDQQKIYEKAVSKLKKEYLHN